MNVIFLGDSDTLKYELNSIHYIHIDPQIAKTILRINSDIYLRPNKNLKNSYFVSLRNTELYIEKANATSLNLKSCLTMIISSISLLRPFVAVYDEDGLVLYIRYFILLCSQSADSSNIYTFTVETYNSAQNRRWFIGQF